MEDRKTCLPPMLTLAARSLVVALPFILMVSCAGGPELTVDEIAAFDTAGWAHDATVEGDCLYISDRQGGISIFERASGWAPGRVRSPVKDVISLAPRSGAPLLASRFEGLVLTDSHGNAVGRLNLGGIANAVAVRGDWAFAAYGVNGLVVAKIEEGGLRLVATLPTPGWSHDVKLRGDRALLADWDYGMRVVDVRVPDKPVEIGLMPTRATAICVAPAQRKGREVAAVAEGQGGVSLVEFDAWDRPVPLSHVSLGLNPEDEPHPEEGGWAHDVAWGGNLLFVANWKRGLVVLDTSDLHKPRIISELPSRGTSLGVTAEVQPDGSTLVFLADGEAGLRIFRFRQKG